MARGSAIAMLSAAGCLAVHSAAGAGVKFQHSSGDCLHLHGDKAVLFNCEGTHFYWDANNAPAFVESFSTICLQMEWPNNDFPPPRQNEIEVIAKKCYDEQGSQNPNQGIHWDEGPGHFEAAYGSGQCMDVDGEAVVFRACNGQSSQSWHVYAGQVKGTANDTYCCTSCAAGGCSAFYSPKDLSPHYACSEGEKIERIPGHGETCVVNRTANDAYCCTSCAAGGCSAFYSPKDLSPQYACSEGEKIEPIPGHGETCKLTVDIVV